MPVLRSNFWLTIHVIDGGLELRGIRPGLGAGPDRYWPIT